MLLSDRSQQEKDSEGEQAEVGDDELNRAARESIATGAGPCGFARRIAAAIRGADTAAKPDGSPLFRSVIRVAFPPAASSQV
jgi:hypothetical protein